MKNICQWDGPKQVKEPVVKKFLALSTATSIHMPNRPTASTSKGQMTDIYFACLKFNDSS